MSMINGETERSSTLRILITSSLCAEMGDGPSARQLSNAIEEVLRPHDIEAAIWIAPEGDGNRYCQELSVVGESLRLGTPATERSFILLLGALTGWPAAARSISRVDYNAILEHTNVSEEADLIRRCYLQDPADEGRMNLQPPADLRTGQWWTTGRRLGAILGRCAEEARQCIGQESLYHRAVQEAESIEAILRLAPENAFCYVLDHQGPTKLIDHLSERILRSHIRSLTGPDRTPGSAHKSPLPAAVCKDIQSLWARDERPASKPPATESTKGPRLDEDVRFTVYKPHVMQPNEWYDLLAFAHRGGPLPDEETGELMVDPIDEVRRRADRLLSRSPRDHDPVPGKSRLPLPRGGELTFVPVVHGIEFNPPRRTFLWLEDVHEELFRIRAPAEADGELLTGWMLVFLGPIIISTISLTLSVDSAHEVSSQWNGGHLARIFCSYSRKDSAIVDLIAAGAKSLGHEVLMDRTHLPTGVPWEEHVERLIRKANIFQLFWSENSMRSEPVRKEYDYALSLRRDPFIYPTFWQDPLPEDPAAGLPPEEIKQLQFLYLPIPDSPEDRPPARRVNQRDEEHEDDDGFVALATPLGSIADVLSGPIGGQAAHNLQSGPIGGPTAPDPFDLQTIRQLPEWLRRVQETESQLGTLIRPLEEQLLELADGDPATISALGSSEDRPDTAPFVAGALRHPPERFSAELSGPDGCEFVFELCNSLGETVGKQRSTAPRFAWPEDVVPEPGSSWQWYISRPTDAPPYDWDTIRGAFVLLGDEMNHAVRDDEEAYDRVVNSLTRSLLLASVRAEHELYQEALEGLDVPAEPTNYDEAIRLRLAAAVYAASRAWLMERLPHWSTEAKWLGDRCNASVRSSYRVLEHRHLKGKDGVQW